MTEKTASGPILCAIDFSDISAAALRAAMAIGDRCAHPVIAMHAHWFEAPPYLTPSQTEAIEAELRSSLEQARSAVDALIQAVAPGRTVAIRIEEGDPRAAILKTAQAAGASMIVMGSHGRSAIRRLALGSVAEEVVHTSPIPVFVVPEATGEHHVSRIVCAVNDSETSRKALLHATKLALCFNAHLTVAHVEERDGARAIPDLCAWIAEQRPPNCDIQEITRRGHALDQILSVVDEVHADLLVIGAEHKLFLDKTALGSTTTQLLRHARCAILIAPGGAIDDAVSDPIEQAA